MNAIVKVIVPGRNLVSMPIAAGDARPVACIE